MRIPTVLVVAFLAALTGCAPALIELAPGARQQLTSAPSVHVVAYPAEAPGLMTAKAIGTGALFGPIGGAVAGARAASIGKDLMEKNKVDDLSRQLAVRLGDELKGALPSLMPASAAPASDDIETLKKSGLRPVVLDVRSAGNIIYYPSNWARYRLIYAARARLVNTDDGTVMWQGFCKLQGPEDPAQSPTLEEIEAPDGNVYRRMITDAVAACATELGKQFRGEAPPKT